MKDAIYLEFSEIVSVRAITTIYGVARVAIEVVMKDGELVDAAKWLASELPGRDLARVFARDCDDTVRRAIVEQVAAEVKP